MPYTMYRKGFTLIELAIVLVIIGLIVGGVLVGRDMITAAELNATISQVSAFRSAVSTFKGKYGALPGDMTTSQAAQFGMIARPGTPGAGNGNGIINDYNFSGSYSSILFSIRHGGENHLFWTDLSSAGLIGNAFTDTTTGAITVAAGQVDSELPRAKIGRGAYFNVIFMAPDGFRNFYSLQTVTSIAAGIGTLQNPLTPREARNIDTKVDDGDPLTGSVAGTSVSDNNCFNWSNYTGVCGGDIVAPAPTLQCVSPFGYNTASTTYADSQQCGLSFAF